ncbi:Protein of unknown function DUF2254, membrane [Isosphaera pallida ATCC 43644]|uniref:DUF2254 domain-containing protein n=1 Tax=Isosphaera pallida (strain ATCC 43644 / DSM 9630 / IS1B) TaxID=575540 RepID=E8QX19_ISOPI|nr:DUF2254 domain-containing protein [Isosphaera pallida]ADV64058.1 Protein of unknown function DUF2254, membrane [Isosphaera pallida ATCC 43644]
MFNLIYAWDRLRSGYWFVPTVVTVLMIGLARLTLALDAAAADHLPGLKLDLFGGGPEGATAILSTVAGSMITIAGLVFSITMVVLTLASSQFGPRLLRNFLRDPISQFVQGCFVAVFLYCLFILGAIQFEGDQAALPQISVLMAIVLAVVNLGALIYYVHHVSVSIHADRLIAAVGNELVNTIDRLFVEVTPHSGSDELLIAESPETVNPDVQFAPILKRLEERAQTVMATQDGYVQMIDEISLVRWAAEHDLVVRMDRLPGHYVLRDGPLASVLVPEGTSWKPEWAGVINRAVVIGSSRTPVQDLEFCLDQLVEIALRALSPGINDPFTAIVCIDRLGSALARLLRRTPPSSYRVDPQGQLRVVIRPVCFPAALNAAFNQLRQFGATSPAVAIRLVETLEAIAHHVRRSSEADALFRHAVMIERACREAVTEPFDLDDLRQRCRSLEATLRERGYAPPSDRLIHSS